MKQKKDEIFSNFYYTQRFDYLDSYLREVVGWYLRRNATDSQYIFGLRFYVSQRSIGTNVYPIGFRININILEMIIILLFMA